MGLGGVAHAQTIGYEQRVNRLVIAPGAFSNVPVTCSAGKKVVGGGFQIETPTDVRVFSSEPSNGAGTLIDNGWSVFVQNAGSSGRQVTASAICVAPAIADTSAPETTISAGPSDTTTAGTATFEFASSESGSSFECSLDLAAYAPCSSPQTYALLADGVHVFAVRAIDSAGNTDPTPATRDFRVQRPLPPPALGREVNVIPVRGEVFVSLPAGTARASASVPGLKGRRFVPLSQARQIPVGSILDTRNGTVKVVAASPRRRRTQSSDFAFGVFQVLQSRRRSARGLTELRLKGSSFRVCGRGKRRSGRAQASRRSRTIRRLRGSGSGRFRTRGRFSAATVRGTDWTVLDRCDGTLTKVARGRVAVRDFQRRKTVLLRAGKSYLARSSR